MPLDIQTLPTRRDEAWKWTDVRGRVGENQKGLSVSGLPKFTLPEGVSVTEVATDDLDTDSPMASLARRFGGQVSGAEPKDPIVVEGLNRGHVRLRLNIGKGAKVSLVEHYAADDGVFCNADITIHLAPSYRACKCKRTLILPCALRRPILRHGARQSWLSISLVLALCSRGLKRVLL